MGVNLAGGGVGFRSSVFGYFFCRAATILGAGVVREI